MTSMFHEALKRLNIRALPAPDLFAPELLVELPATAELERKRNDLAAQLAIEQEALSVGGRASVADRALLASQQALQRAEARLEQGRYRDRLSAERPADCWCLGLGGRGEMSLRDWPDDDPLNGMTFAEFCSCTDGQAVLASARERTRQGKSERVARRLRRVWNEQTGIPREFHGLSLDSWGERVDRLGGQPSADLAGLRVWLESDRWLILAGPPGRGKTGLAVALLREIVYATGCSARFTGVVDLYDEMTATFGRKPEQGVTTEELLSAVEGVNLLVLDDYGADRPSDWRAERFYRLINKRWAEQRRTIITTNLGAGEFAARVDERVWDRIRQRSDIVVLDGPNLRESAA